MCRDCKTKYKMIYLYKILGFILIPFIKLNIFIRIKNGKEILSRYKERYGITNLILKSNKKVIWIHAASLGEFKSTDYLINRYSEKYTILVTTTTVSSANYAIKNYGNKIIHQFAPLDISIWINRFLRKWNPIFVIWVESDLWPNTLNIIKNKKIDAILVNVRLSPNSFKRWSIIPSFYNNIINSFLYVYAQSKIDQERIQKITNKKINFIGNLKLTSINKLPNNKINNIKNKAKKITIMLASTHPGEEAKLIPIFKILLNEFKDLFLIIAPRHPHRSKELVSLCEKFDLTSCLESKNTDNLTNSIIIDSFGILSSFFSISDIVFVGGSLVKVGGHNPIEPALHKCAILTGDQIFNWHNIYKDMIKSKACLKINYLEQLKIQLINLIKNKNELDNMKNRAYKFSQKKFVDTDFLESTINRILNNKIC